MKRIVIVGCVACAAVVLMLMRPRSTVASRSHRRAMTNELSVGIPPTPAHASGQAKPTGSALPGTAAGSTHSTNSRRLSIAEVEPLLQRRTRLDTREIPALDAEVEAELCKRYVQTVGVADKYAILKVLALGGSSKCIPLFTNAIYGEFRGRRVSVEDSSLLLHVPMLLGFLAHREPSAIEALHAMADAVAAGHLWHENSLSPETDTVRVRVFQGLGASGRPEVKAWLESCRTLPASANSFPRGVVEAAFNYWLVETFGFDVSVSDHQDNPQKLLMAADTWLGSPDGRCWLAWDKDFNPGR